jgi:hypothetical protein
LRTWVMNFLSWIENTDSSGFFQGRLSRQVPTAEHIDFGGDISGLNIPTTPGENESIRVHIRSVTRTLWFSLFRVLRDILRRYLG